MIELLPEHFGFSSPKTTKAYASLQQLLGQLRERELPEKIVGSINQYMQEVPEPAADEKAFRKKVRKVEQKIRNLVQKELGLVSEGYYRNMWMSLGIGAFGVPLGVAFGSALGNMGLMGVGLPIGLAIGVSIGMSLENKAKREGKVLPLK